MKKSVPWVVCALLLLVTAADAGPNDVNELLRGSYAFTGEANCRVFFDSAGGPTPRVISFAVEGVRTFNGDGTGTLSGRSVNFFNNGLSFFSGEFTYAVAPDGGTFTSEVASLTFTDSDGNPAGTLEASGTDPLIPVAGHISRDRNTLVFATAQPAVEMRTFADGSSERRICHRARTATKIR